jgi:hypothetical protein
VAGGEAATTPWGLGDDSDPVRAAGPGLLAERGRVPRYRY